MTTAERTADAIDPRWFRQVLGRYPTGVCAITAVDPESGPAGMTVGSFTSVSLDPPLVAFLPDRKSTSWPKIQRSGAFCVNILGFDQERIVRQFSASGTDKFAGLDYRLGGSGSPVLPDVVAWIDCDIASVTEAGDHFVVIGAVRELQLESPRLPLLFFEGGYGRFSPSSMTAVDPHGLLANQIRMVDLIRGELESLATDLQCRATLSAQVGDEVIIVAQSGQSRIGDPRGTLVGQRLPFVPPTGAVWAAWSAPDRVDSWLRMAPGPEGVERARQALAVVRARGFSMALKSSGQRAFAAMVDEVSRTPASVDRSEILSIVQNLVYDPDELTDEARAAIRQLSAPVFDADGAVGLAMTVSDFDRPRSHIDDYIDRLCAAASASTRVLGGRRPE